MWSVRAGAQLSQPVESIKVERRGGQHFRVGVAEMNGWRKGMEDAHVVHLREERAVFGVFDGHGGSECSEFVARKLEQEFNEHGIPTNNERVEALMFRVDQEFLDTSNSTSGSTGTFVIVEPHLSNAAKRHLRVGNIGDSRVLLGRRDGSMFRGQGTDFGLTEDHKPDSETELARIVASGNEVVDRRGVPRINGNLAVSRSFGDVRFKIPNYLDPKYKCVCAQADFCDLECEQTDFLMLVCDGISEGNFSNASAVYLAAEELHKHGDPGRAAVAVCRKALVAGSTDNLTCMIVLLSGGKLPKPEKEYIAGPLSTINDFRFLKAYLAHVDRAGVPVPILDTVRPFLDRQITCLQMQSTVSKQMETSFDAAVTNILQSNEISHSSALAAAGKAVLARPRPQPGRLTKIPFEEVIEKSEDELGYSTNFDFSSAKCRNITRGSLGWTL